MAGAASCLTSLCSADVIATKTAAHVAILVNDFYDAAVVAEAALNTAMAGVATNFDASVTNPTYAPSMTGISTTFVAPTAIGTADRPSYTSLQPTAVTNLSRSALLTSVGADALFVQERDKLLSGFSDSMRELLELAGDNSIGLANPQLLTGLRKIGMTLSSGVQEQAKKRAEQEGIWDREDIITALEMELQNFKAKWDVIQARLAAEEATFRGKIGTYLAFLQRTAEELGWTDHRINQMMEEAAVGTDTAIKWGRVTLDKLLQIDQITIEMKTGMVQMWLQSAHLGLDFQGSQSVNAAG